MGRETYSHRLAVCADNLAGAIDSLQRVTPNGDVKRAPSIVFMFSGQGAQYLRMGADLYAAMPTFRRWVETCRDLLKPLIDVDIEQALYAAASNGVDPFSHAYVLQPALFAVEYAMARTLMELGIQPSAVVGHSLGEYTAACIAGVLSLEDALSMVAARGLAMEAAGEGAMLAVNLSEPEVNAFLAQRGQKRFDDGPDVGVAAVNAPGRVVLSGSPQAVDHAGQALQDAGVSWQRVHVNRAFHSPMMAQAAKAIVAKARAVTLQPPKIPLASNLTGEWLTDAQATDPAYWGAHMLQAVRFCDNVQCILAQQPDVLLEVGPGRILSSLAADIQSQSKPSNGAAALIAPTMRHPRDTRASDTQFLYSTLARLWTHGAQIDWPALHERASAAPRVAAAIRLCAPALLARRQRHRHDPSPPGRDAATHGGPTRPARAARAVRCAQSGRAPV